MFIDQAKISVKAGNGGNGSVSFRREKYVPKGGPDGGNGGRGGSIYFVATHNISTLSDFRFGVKLKASDGGHGALKNQYGKSGEDRYINVPVGTVVLHAESGEVLADFKNVGETVLIAKGGRGGRGNTAFKSSLNRVPRIAENGLPGEEFNLILELKLLADIGFIGLPNVGKSTLLSTISSARPTIANYPFTTLHPELGVVVTKNGESFVASDLPGIIDGAHLGKGLGLRFLRHAQRCRVIIYIIDGETREDYAKDFKILQKEVKKYGYGLETRPFIVGISKVESEETEKRVRTFAKKVKKGEVIGFSSLLNYNIELLKNLMAKTISAAPDILLLDEKGKTLTYREYDLTKQKDDAIFKIVKEKRGLYRITGEEVEARYAKYTLNSDEAVLRLLNYLREIGVEEALENMGVSDGDSIILGDFEFEYYR